MRAAGEPPAGRGGLGALLSLVRIETKAAFGLGGGSGAGLRPKLKAAGIAALVLIVLADLGVIFVASAIGQYQALKPAGLEGLLLLNAAITASLVVFVLAFITVLSGFGAAGPERQLVALPIPASHLLASRFALVWLSHAAIALFLVGINLAVFAVNEAPPAGFYLCGLLAALGLPALPVALAFLVVVPLVGIARFLKNKNAVLVIGGFVGVAFALAFNLFVQGSMARMGDPEWILAHYAGPGTILNLLGSAWPPALAAWNSLEAAASGGWAEGLAWALGLVAAGLLAALAVVALLGRLYVKSVLEFGEGRLRRLARREARNFIARSFSRRRDFLALVLRESRLMNREPSWFLNGPFIIVLMPVILAAMYFVQRGNIPELEAAMAAARDGGAGPLAAAALGAFLGSSTSISCTALSRDAKGLPFLLALPLTPAKFMFAKLAHGLLWSFAGALVGSLGAALVLGLPPLDLGLAVFAALSFAALANLAGLWLDTANPRLSWDNPLAALKQNPNSIIAILGSMALLGALGALAAVLEAPGPTFAAAVGAGCCALSAALFVLYPPFARAKLASIEA